MLLAAAGPQPCKSREVGSGAAKRQAREPLIEAARHLEIDVVMVWRLDRWGRSVTDLPATLQELEHLSVGFVSLTEALVRIPSEVNNESGDVNNSSGRM